jgi:serine/threonine-protein kinase HipA
MATDFRSVEELLVFRGGEHVANLRRLPKGCEFRYTNEYLRSAEPPIALHLPKTEEGLAVEGMANLPTYFAGILPEGVMFTAIQKLIRSAADDLFAMLAATGADAIGDIEVRVPGEPERKPALNLAEAAEQIHLLLSAEGGFRVENLSGISGAQPKMSIGELVRASRTGVYIAKFASPDFPRVVENEFACMRLAKHCRLDVPNVKQQSGALVVQRFDRVLDKDRRQVQKIHVEDMLQVMDLFPNAKYSVEYVEIMRSMQDLGVSKASLLDALRLYVFSYIIGNGDLHAKNVSVLFDKSARQWRLSPAYDLLSTLPYVKQLSGSDRMTLALVDESFGRFTTMEFVEFGLGFGLPEKAVREMIRRTSMLVLRHLPGLEMDFPSSGIIPVISGRAESLLSDE